VLAVGVEAPDFTQADLDGRFHTLSERRGMRVMLAFFATW
jgi:peroxiredoxin